MASEALDQRDRNETFLEPPSSPWASSVTSVTDSLCTSIDGLSQEEATRRLNYFGPNRVLTHASLSPWKILLRQFRSLIVALLVVAAIISIAIGDWVEALAVFAVVLINATIGFFTELKANRSMDALKNLTRQMVRLRRGGDSYTLSADDLVPGDIVIVEAGDIVPADLRILDANLLQADESSLTGESLPIRKQSRPVSPDTILAERRSMLFRGARITEGTGSGVVTATGVKSELGRISELVNQAERKSTPLERQLNALGYRLIRIASGLTLGIAIMGIIMGRDLVVTLQTAIALTIAAIPEGLPVVATIALARGLWRMAERNALINHLSAVETLGSTEVICTDKTGTLTENRMKVSVIWPAGSDTENRLSASGADDPATLSLLEVSSLCNNAHVSKEGLESVGDPLELALLEGALESGFDLEALHAGWERLREIPFTADTRRMATVDRNEAAMKVSVKGAPEAIFPLCPDLDQTANPWETRNTSLAARGLRVIALAGKRISKSDEDPFSDLEFYGLVGLIDPPRKDVPDAIEACLSAGIRVVMVTGDQGPTANSIASEIGIEQGEVLTGTEFESLDPSLEADRNRLLRATVISRATPTQKFKLIQLYQEEGKIVAMTGDGVNDAPALKQADIGIAMGLRGTDVAREAAAMVLRDDAFPSIVAAIEQGRTIFSNIRKFVAYLISCNLSEILVVATAMLFSAKLPILPLQILFLNLVTDVFPALALGVTQSRANVLSHRPRARSKSILERREWLSISWQAAVIAGATLSAFYVSMTWMGKTEEEAITVSFLTLAIAQLAHVFNMADRDENYFSSMIVRNPMIWAAHLICLILLAAACYQPFLLEVLSLRTPEPKEWGIIAAFSSAPIVIGLVMRRFP